jgi:hypothetical protein
MEFQIKTINESLFAETLRKIVEENDILPPNDITINRDSGVGVSTYILSDMFMSRLKEANPAGINELQSIH